MALQGCNLAKRTSDMSRDKNRASRQPVDAIRQHAAAVCRRMDGIVRILKSTMSFYDGTAMECPAVTLDDLLTEDDPVIPFLESVASHEVDPRDLANLRKQLDEVSKMVDRACDRLYERFRMVMANNFKSDLRKFFSVCLVPGAPEGWSRSAWICSRGFNAMFSWIHLCYGVELREEDCLRTAIAVPGFRIETAGERISRMKAHIAWDLQFKSAVPNITNCATFFLEVTKYLNYLVDDSPKYFVYDLKEKKGPCEEEVSYALRASMDHAPFDKYMAAEASHWIRLARIRMITALANSFVYRCQDDKDDQQAFDLWQELNSMIVLQDTKLKLDFEPDEVSLIIRLADLAAERAHDYWKDKRQYDNVLPLAKMSPTDKPGVDLCDLRPLDNHPFKWRGPIVAWYERLKRGYEAKADSKSILDIIDNTTFAALEYYRVLTIGAPYLRGEADRKPEPFTGKDGEVREFERILTSSVERVLLKPMAAIIEQLPSLNTAVAGYPIERLEDLFKALNLFATAMNHCEEEKTSAEGLGLGQAIVETLLLGRLVCPKKNAQGRYVLERSLIAEKFRDFHKSIRLAACCIKRKAEKRAGGKIELGDLEDGEKKGLGIGDQGLGSGEDLNADRVRDTQEEAFSDVATTDRNTDPTPQSKNALSASKGASRSGEMLEINEKFEDEQSEKFFAYLRDNIQKQKSVPRDEQVEIPVSADCFTKYYRKLGFEKAGLSLQDFGTYAISLFNAFFHYPVDRPETFLADMLKEYCGKGEDENGNVTDRELIPHLIYENAKFARRIIKYMAYFRGECEWLEGSLSFADAFASDMRHFIEEFTLVCEVFGSYAMREKYTQQLRRTTAPIEIVVEEIRKIFPSEELERFKDKLWFFTYAFLYTDTNEKGSLDLTKDRVNALRDAADALVKNIETNEREFNLKRNKERFARAGRRDSGLGNGEEIGTQVAGATRDLDDAPESVELSSELADLFRRGTDMTKEIARRVETCKAAYLGQSKKRPRFLLSATFDSKTGPSLPYFTETIHTLRPVIRDRRPRYGEQLDVFERASGETLELLRVFFGLLSDFLNPAQAEQLRIALYTFRTANGRFFRHLRNGGDLAESVFSSIVSEGIALSTASMYLDILAGALRTRERQLGYLTDQLPDAQAPDRSAETDKPQGEHSASGEGEATEKSNGFAPLSAKEFAVALREELRPDFDAFHQEHQDIGKGVATLRRSLGAKLDNVIRWYKSWLAIIAKTFREKKIPRKEVVAAVNGRYGDVDWTKYTKYANSSIQIKAVIDYTHDTQAITTKTSPKHYKKASGGYGKNLKDVCRDVWDLHKVEWDVWAVEGTGYPTVKDLYDACFGIMKRKKGTIPFKLA